MDDDKASPDIIARDDRIESRRQRPRRNRNNQPIFLKEAAPLGFFSPSPPTIYYFRRLFGSFAAASPATMSAAKTKAQGLIDNNAVVVFSKSYCPYCSSSKQLLSSFDAKYTVVELDELGKPLSALIYLFALFALIAPLGRDLSRGVLCLLTLPAGVAHFLASLCRDAIPACDAMLLLWF